MDWKTLPTDYTDAVWNGLKKYNMINNSDGTVSFDDKTVYTGKENSFFGAAEANAMNAAMNKLAGNMETVEERAASAEASADNAFNYANEAKSSATTATTAKNNASESATAAANSATAAANSATTASQKATAAASSATAAANSASVAQASAAKVTMILFDNAGAHNAIYRGKNLGTSVTSAQWAAIANDTFIDLYIGDYEDVPNRS